MLESLRVLRIFKMADKMVVKIRNHKLCKIVVIKNMHAVIFSNFVNLQYLNHYIAKSDTLKIKFARKMASVSPKRRTYH